MILEINKKKCTVQCESCSEIREAQTINAKIAQKRTGKNLCKKCCTQDPVYKAKMAKSCFGEKNGFYGKTHSEETRKKLSEIGKLRIYPKGRKFSEEQILKMSLARKGILAGDKNPNWRGGISSLRKKIYNCFETKFWRKTCLKRDGYKCTHCGSIENLEIDHIKPFALIIEENNIKSIEEAIRCDELWDMDNGRTLCEKCHMKTDTWGNNTKQLLNKIKIEEQQ